ncbi:MAG: hypothetical protein BGO11_13370 [Solirubrobacterales bacterium 70-9]|nr:MAG: hypothetical protein BGO11_13370 [Solirubrobacterales bacterium 70-9]
MLFGAEPAISFVEIRHTRQGRGMGQVFLGVREVEQWARTVEKLTGTGDVYVGVGPRTQRAGTRESVARLHVLWADIDTDDAVAALRTFEPAPPVVIRSGTPGHLQAYWPLRDAVGPDQAEIGNRRIAHAIGADMKSTDAARILRPPGTFNRKREIPQPVRAARLDAEVFDYEDIVGTLADPPARAQDRPRVELPRERVADDSPGAQDAAVALIGRYSPEADLRPSGNGRLHGSCPFEFHEDRNPSFGLFPDGGYICSCGTGDIVRLFVNLRGEQFTDRDLPRYRRELREDLGLAVAA